MLILDSWHFNAHSLFLFASALLTAVLALVGWTRRPAAGAGSYAVLMAFVSEWMLLSGMLKGAPNAADYTVCWQALWVARVCVAPLWFVFTLEYTQQNEWIKARYLLMLWAMPAITIVFILTNGFHHLMWAAPIPLPHIPGMDPLVFKTKGPWFIVQTAYSYLLYIPGTFAIILALALYPQRYRSLSAVMVAGAMCPLIATVLVVTKTWPLAGTDPTPFAFCLSALFFALGLFRHGLFELTPVARDSLVEIMSDGVLVLDRMGRIIDSNPAAHRMLGITDATGQTAEKALAGFPELLLFCESNKSLQRTICLPETKNLYKRHIDVRQTALEDGRKAANGKLVLLRDVTAQSLAEIQLRNAHDQLQQRLSEIGSLQEQLREQAIRDVLTGLYNRRYLEETLDREVTKAKRKPQDISVVLIDIDRFKGINDTYGHSIGDQVLRSLGQLLRRSTRGGDVACRYGGEEFVVVMTETNAESAARRAEEWRTQFEEDVVVTPGQLLRCTFSAGVAQFALHGVTGDEIILAADKALYSAKTSGRNQVVVFGDNMEDAASGREQVPEAAGEKAPERVPVRPSEPALVATEPSLVVPMSPVQAVPIEPVQAVKESTGNGAVQYSFEPGGRLSAPSVVERAAAALRASGELPPSDWVARRNDEIIWPEDED